MRRIARITPRLAVLGLVVQESGTVAEIGRRFGDVFANAGFPRNSVHTNLPSLARQGQLRLVEPGPTRKGDRYEAMPDGVAEVREWLRSESLPAIPDLIEAVLAFAELEDLPAIVHMLREDAESSRVACELVFGRVATHKRLRRHQGEGTWRDGLRLIGLEYQAKKWFDRALAVEQAADGIERVLGEVAAHGV